MPGIGGRAQRERAAARPCFMADLSGVFEGRILVVPGGVLVPGGAGAVIGAVGVTGDTCGNDAAAAEAGIRAAGCQPEA